MMCGRRERGGDGAEGLCCIPCGTDPKDSSCSIRQGSLFFHKSVCLVCFLKKGRFKLNDLNKELVLNSCPKDIAM